MTLVATDRLKFFFHVIFCQWWFHCVKNAFFLIFPALIIFCGHGIKIDYDLFKYVNQLEENCAPVAISKILRLFVWKTFHLYQEKFREVKNRFLGKDEYGLDFLNQIFFFSPVASFADEIHYKFKRGFCLDWYPAGSSERRAECGAETWKGECRDFSFPQNWDSGKWNV